MQRRRAALTIDLEDYRRQELRDCLGGVIPPHPAEVERQLDALLELLDDCDAHATVFAVGRLASELPRRCWSAILSRHTIGCHGHQHLRVEAMGPAAFKSDLIQSKASLEEAASVELTTFRAPYFSADRCDPWFGEILSQCGFSIDSSRRLPFAPPGFSGLTSLPGSDGSVREIPLLGLGYGSKRITVIGGTYLRLLCLRAVFALLALAERQGFIPVVYLHPYDLDPRAKPLDLPMIGHTAERLGDKIRHLGRSGVAEKLRALSRVYEFRSIEYLVSESSSRPRSPENLTPREVTSQ